ncbi:MAG: YIP1 family protein [Pseudomonadota bacterium]
MVFTTYLFRRMLEGLFEPRRSAQWVLEGKWSMETAVQLVVLAYALSAMLSIVIPGGPPSPDSGVVFVQHALLIVVKVVYTGILALAAWGIGALFGGRGSFDEAIPLFGWHALVTVLLSPLASLAAGQMPQPDADVPLIDERGQVTAEALAAATDVPPGAAILLLTAFFISLWLMASYVAELHRFESTWKVFGVIVAVPMFFGMMLLSAIS